MTIREAQQSIHAVAIAKGWYDADCVRSPGDYIALAHTELSEAYEELRTGEPADEVYFEAGGKPCGFGIELADCVIRLLDTAEHFGLDLQELIALKMTYNATRPHRHGDKKL